ncbi:hypothetical protein Poly59_30760 [Rubripirellula reticaptiva]|uniref:Uncharacterized protein n=1 Tax=Rubripirellula reticaptiva TaxID=2528013 RepID=A0A5C6ESZ1_9BACT|nr:hypothetical protein Poly59_30760 [Rubripirellula reticaptiva]
MQESASKSIPITIGFTELEGKTLSAEKSASTTSVQSLVIWRVRLVSCDGMRQGREWSAEFFTSKESAERRLQESIDESDRRNPKYLFESQQEDVDGLRGNCNWQFGEMLVMDAVEAK